MFLWFVGGGALVVALVFQSPALDYRLVMAGSVLPLLDALSGGVWVLHTLVAAIVALAAVMAATRRHRLVRRRWLGIPIGMFVHLALDGVWTNRDVFWWPFFGLSFAHDRLPELSRGPASVVLEVVGLGALVWAWRRFGFDDPAARARFVRTGQLPRGWAR